MSDNRICHFHLAARTFFPETIHLNECGANLVQFYGFQRHFFSDIREEKTAFDAGIFNPYSIPESLIPTIEFVVPKPLAETPKPCTPNPAPQTPYLKPGPDPYSIPASLIPTNENVNTKPQTKL